MGVGTGKAEFGVYIVVVSADVGVGTKPLEPVVLIVVSGPLNCKKTFACVMVAVDNLGVDEPSLVMCDKVGVSGLLHCVAPSGCGCDWVTGGAGTGGTGIAAGDGGGGCEIWN